MFTKAFLADLTERAVSTAAQTFLAAYLVSGIKAASLTAAGAGGLAVVKALAAGVRSRHEGVATAALLPASVAPVAPPEEPDAAPRPKRRARGQHKRKRVPS
jgi:hypothetical protein